MKIRCDFVTNSSSSSFIAINKGNYKNCNLEIEEDLDNFTLFESGNKEFGWDFKEFSDIRSKVNYILIQMSDLMEYGKDKYFSKEIIQTYRKMIESVLSNNLGINIDWNELQKRKDSSHECIYVDHQSNFYECPYLVEFLLESESRLEDFIFNDKSVIITGNDNVYDEGGNFNGLDSKYRYNSDYITY